MYGVSYCERSAYCRRTTFDQTCSAVGLWERGVAKRRFIQTFQKASSRFDATLTERWTHSCVCAVPHHLEARHANDILMRQQRLVENLKKFALKSLKVYWKSKSFFHQLTLIFESGTSPKQEVEARAAAVKPAFNRVLDCTSHSLVYLTKKDSL